MLYGGVFQQCGVVSESVTRSPIELSRGQLKNGSWMPQFCPHKEFWIGRVTIPPKNDEVIYKKSLLYRVTIIRTEYYRIDVKFLF